LPKVKEVQLPATWSASGEGCEFDVAYDDEDGNHMGWLSSASVQQGVGTLKQTLSSQEHLGKRIKLVGSCRAENVSITAGLMLRTQRANGRPLTIDDMLDRPLVGTTDWL
jgi:hypothetical protein